MSSIVLALALLFTPQPKAVLKWTSSDQVVNYRVWRGAKSGGPYTEIASGIHILTYTDSKIIPGNTYYYVVDCRNPATNLVSPYSNEVKAVVP